MNCDVVKDLIPLYIDRCCSEESERQIKEHLEICNSCKQFFLDMSAPTEIIKTENAPEITFRKINDWKASVLQSALLFLSFFLITIGVALEAGVGNYNMFNGVYAINLVIPSTGFMLSLANWYFVRVYKNRKVFSTCSLLATFFITLCAYVWSCFHYKLNLIDLFNVNSLYEFFDVMQGVAFLGGFGFLLTFVFCILSKVLSDRYAKMLGKE